MTSYLQDSDLNRLVDELNRGVATRDDAVGLPAASGPIDRAEPNAKLEELLGTIVKQNATDLHLVAGVVAAFRINGEIRYASDIVVTNEQLQAMVPNAKLSAELRQFGMIDFSAEARGGETRSAFRFRINMHRQRGNLAASIRLLPSRVPTFAELNLPRPLVELTKATRGLVIVGGPTGSGKSTTLAALVDEINRTSARHIITIEDPLEYDHKNDRSLVEQIEVGKDARSFADALRGALRQDPDVILVGEMRDLETVAIALTAAETGHLIFSTLHTSGPAQSINRIVDVYPANQHGQVYKQIALSLNAVVHQKLVPRADGRGVVPAVELLIANIPVRHQIRSGRLEGLHNEITLGRRQGMISFDDSLRELAGKGLISLEDALSRANDPEELRRHAGPPDVSNRSGDPH